MKPKNKGNSNLIDKLFLRWVNGLMYWLLHIFSSIAQTKSLEISDFKDLEIDGNS